MPCDLYVTWNLSSLSSLIIFIIGSNSNFTLRESPKPFQFSSVQSRSRVQLCNPMDCSMPGFPVHHQLLELAQTHIHRVSDAIQPSHPLSSPSPPAFNFSQHQGLFQWVSSLQNFFIKSLFKSSSNYWYSCILIFVSGHVQLFPCVFIMQFVNTDVMLFFTYSKRKKRERKVKKNYSQNYFWMLGVGCVRVLGGAGGGELGRWHWKHFLNQHLMVLLLKFVLGILSQEFCPISLALLIPLFLTSSHSDCHRNWIVFLLTFVDNNTAFC